MKLTNEKLKYYLNLRKAYKRSENVWDKMRNNKMILPRKFFDDLINENEEINLQNRSIWFYRAISLDYTGEHFDALEIFLKLVELYPNKISYTKSVEICCSQIEKMAFEIFSRDSKSSMLIKIRNILFEVTYVPYWLNRAWAEILIQEGKAQEAKDYFLNLMELSPSDNVYLRGNMDLAILCEDKEWAERVSNLVQKTIEKHPYRLDLYDFLLIE